MSVEVELAILLDNEIILVATNPDDSIAGLFEKLQKHTSHSKYIPANTSYRDCQFYRLIQPVLTIQEDDEDDENVDEFVSNVKEACLKEDNQKQIAYPSITLVRTLKGKKTNAFKDDHIYLVIHVPDFGEKDETSRRQEEEDRDVFDCDSVREILSNRGLEIRSRFNGHPGVAMAAGPNSRQCIKFVTSDKEIEVLKYLSGIDSPSNYTVSAVQFWPVEGGTLISMPFAGEWLTRLYDPDKHLWSVARQLFEAVGFMHKNNIAHMDLKPPNILIPRNGGRLSIIDFNFSIYIRTPDTKYTGVVGTDGYIAPEVHKGEYKPLLADLWSCGSALEDLCSSCSKPSAERKALFGIADKLMDPNPEARPKMSAVLEWMRLKQGGGKGVRLELQ